VFLRENLSFLCTDGVLGTEVYMSRKARSCLAGTLGASDEIPQDLENVVW